MDANSASIYQINPNTLVPQELDSKDANIVSFSILDGKFNPLSDKIEIFVYDEGNNLVYSDYNFEGWSSFNDSLKVKTSTINTIDLNPLEILNNLGIDNGTSKIIYNFIQDELESSLESSYYISDISSDRTELRLKTNIDYNLVKESYNQYLSGSIEFFDEFYLNFRFNQYAIGVNILLDEDNSALLVKLYEPLPLDFGIKSELFFVSKKAESIGYEIVLPNYSDLTGAIKIKGPNLNIDYTDGYNPSNLYQNELEITSTLFTSSFNQLRNLIKNKGVLLTPDFNEFSNFIKFSSAKQRILNFYDKASLIESYTNQINVLNTLTGSVSQSLAFSSSINILNNNIQQVIYNFDSYDNFLYYESSSLAWPKSNSVFPYTLYSTASIEVTNWMGSDDETSAYYGGIILSASLYDNGNQDYLFYLIPEFIKENPINNPYILFVDMMGQYFDDIWLYIKYITKKLSQDNRLDYGIPQDLTSKVLESLGIKIYGNQLSLENIYSSLIGITPSGSLTPVTGSEYITNYINVLSGSTIPYSLNDINKEVFKRIHHNLIYILKQKGTAQGLKELINIYGIPESILEVNEGSKKNQVSETNNAKQSLFNYAYYVSGSTHSGVRVPFAVPGSLTNRPKSIVLRFKPKDIWQNGLIAGPQSQSIYYIGQSGGGEGPTSAFSLVVEHTGSLITGSYSGSIPDPYYNWATVKFLLSGSGDYNTASVFAPIFNDSWWSVMVNKESDKISLYLKNKRDDDLSDSNIQFQYSASITSTATSSWDTPVSANTRAILRLGVNNTTNGIIYTRYEGSFQELRYYTSSLSEYAFDSFVLNPTSIEGNQPSGSQDAYNILSFRAPLGTDLKHTDWDYRSISLDTSSNCYDPPSMHPSTTGSNPTSSFPGNALVVDANRYLTPEIALSGSQWNWVSNNEYVYLREVDSGLKTFYTDNIKIENTDELIGDNDFVLSNQKQLYTVSDVVNNNNITEVVFSPQNQINYDIIDQLGEFNLGNFLHPQNLYSTSSIYPELKRLKERYFSKYIKPYNIWDYIRLIRNYDNSLFKIIKNYVPSNTNLVSGLVIKSHLLERNKHPQPSVNITSSIANININQYYLLENIVLTGSLGAVPSQSLDQRIYNSTNDLTSSLPIETFSGGAGGVMPYSSSLSQSWTYELETIVGRLNLSHSIQDEFINGEFTGSSFPVVTQSLNPDCAELLEASTVEVYYRPFWFKTNFYDIDKYLSMNTAPSGGEMYLLYDTGSIYGYTAPYTGSEIVG